MTQPAPPLRIGGSMGLGGAGALGISPSTPPPLSSTLPRPPKPTVLLTQQMQQPAHATGMNGMHSPAASSSNAAGAALVSTGSVPAAATVHSSPSTRLGAAEPEAAYGLQWGAQPFALNLEHFSQPSTPVGSSSSSALSSRSASFIALPAGYFDEDRTAVSAAGAVLSPPSSVKVIERQKAAAAAAHAAQVSAQHRAAVAHVEKQRRERRAAAAAAAGGSNSPTLSGSLPRGSPRSPRSLSLGSFAGASSSINSSSSLRAAAAEPSAL